MIPKPEPRPKKPPKRMKQRGKRTNEWLAFRRQWLKDNPPAYDDSYVCGICGTKVHITDMELDHILQRSTHPQLRFEASNVRPTHKYCNQTR